MKPFSLQRHYDNHGTTNRRSWSMLIARMCFCTVNAYAMIGGNKNTM